MKDILPDTPRAQAKRVLVLHDLHPDTDNAAWRGGLLAQALGGWLRILHVTRFGDIEYARTRLAPLAWRLQEHLQLAVLPQAVRGSLAGELKRAAEDAGLVVMRAPSGLAHATGPHPLRVAGIAQVPTLVVRSAATTPYRRVLVGADPERDDGHGSRLAAALADGKEMPATAPLLSAVALLERERALFPDLVVLPCGPATSIARRFLALTGTDTLLLPTAAATARTGARHEVPHGLAPEGAR